MFSRNDTAANGESARSSIHRQVWPCTFLLVGILLTACSSSDGGPTTEGSADLNTLSGTLIVSGVTTRSVGEVFAINMSTRIARPYVLLETNDSQYGVSNTFREPTHIQNGELLVGVNGCVDLDNRFTVFCVERVGINNTVDRLFTSEGWIQAGPSLSPDQTLVAMVTSNTLITGPSLLRLYSTSGEIVEETELSTRVSDISVSNIEWTEDNRLVYGVRLVDTRTELVITEPRSLAPSDDHSQLDLLTDAAGGHAISTISLAPNDRTVAFDLIPDQFATNNVKRAFVLDLDSGETMSIASNTNRDVWAPEWSPDGSRLLVNHSVGGFSAGSIVAPFQMLIEWRGAPVEIDVFDQDGEIRSDESLFVVDTREALGLSFINERWLFNERKTWIP